jgi:hypothetical protein
MMEASSTSEMSANFYQTARRYNPEDSHYRVHNIQQQDPFLSEMNPVCVLHIFL